jgi:uncharacterized protein YdhG (YjbR/CyaY superfamily)
MKNQQAETVDDYIDLQPHAARAVLERVRQAIRKAVPEAEECISYKIPAYKLKGRILIYFAGWKEHYSIYPAGDAMAQSFEGELDRYRVSKGTLRFPLSEPVPVKLIARIVKFRAEEMTKRKTRPLRKAAVKGATSKTRTRGRLNPTSG